MPKLRYLGFDLIAVALFALFARVAHNSSELPLSVLGVLQTFWPFALGTLLGWTILVLANRTPTGLAPAGVVVWLSTAVVGLVNWGFRHGGIPHWSFMIVATVFSGLLIMGWRFIATRVKS